MIKAPILPVFAYTYDLELIIQSATLDVAGPTGGSEGMIQGLGLGPCPFRMGFEDFGGKS